MGSRWGVAVAAAIMAASGCLSSTGDRPAPHGVPAVSSPSASSVTSAEDVSLQVDFGDVKLGGDERLEVTVRNTGEGAFEIDAKRSEYLDQGFRYAFDSTAVSAGSYTRLFVAFSPQQAGPVEAALSFALQNAEPPALRVNLRGNGVP